MVLMCLTACQNPDKKASAEDVSPVLSSFKANGIKTVYVYTREASQPIKTLETEMRIDTSGYPNSRIHYENGKVYKYETLVYDNMYNITARYEGKTPDDLTLVYTFEKNMNQEITKHFDTTGYLLKQEIIDNDNEGLYQRKVVKDQYDKVMETTLFEWVPTAENDVLKATTIGKDNTLQSTTYFTYDAYNLIESVVVHESDTLEIEKNTYNANGMPTYHLFIDYKDSTKTEVHTTYSDNHLILKQVELISSLQDKNTSPTKTEIFYEYKAVD
jgi:hypothetical protein